MPDGLPALFKKLAAPFPEEEVGKLPRSTCRDCSQSQRKRCDRHAWVNRCSECGNNHSSATMHIDYVGHADVTARLLSVDNEWTWDFVATDPTTGAPLLDNNGGLWINLTVLGVTRKGYGDQGQRKGQTDGMKEAIGDALRNAAMRFGVALDLWAKGDRAWSKAEKDGVEIPHPDAQPPSPDPDAGDLGAALDTPLLQVMRHIGNEFKMHNYPHDQTRRERIIAILGRDIPLDTAADPGLTLDEAETVLAELKLEPYPEVAP